MPRRGGARGGGAGHNGAGLNGENMDRGIMGRGGCRRARGVACGRDQDVEVLESEEEKACLFVVVVSTCRMGVSVRRRA